MASFEEQFYKLSKRLRPEDLCLSPNLSIRIVLERKEEFETEEQWFNTTKSQGIKLSDIIQNPDLPWDPEAITLNPNITIEDVFRFPELFQYPSLISGNPFVKVSEILKYPELVDFYRLSSNPTLTIHDVMSNLTPQWHFDLIVSNPGIRGKDILDNLQVFIEECGGNFFTLFSLNPNVSLEHSLDPRLVSQDFWFLFHKVDKNSLWEFETLSTNPITTVRDILLDKSKPWRNNKIVNYLSQKGTETFRINPFVTIKELVENPNNNWDWEYFSKSIPMEDILDHPELPWKYFWVVENQTLKFEHTSTNPYRHDERFWRAFSQHSGLRIQDVLDNPELPWFNKYLAQNPFTTDKCNVGKRTKMTVRK